MSVANDALLEMIRQRLASDSRLAALAIDAMCYEGFVALVGKVDSSEQKRLAVELVTGLIGVRNVRDDLLVSSAGASSQAIAG